MPSLTAHPASNPVKLCLFGAAPNTSNLGVSALYLSVMHAISKRYPDAQVTVFDYGPGPRPDVLHFDGSPFHFTRCGANWSRRYYRRDNLINMRLSAALGGMGNPGVRAISEADAVLDISGGDSFADLYGAKRFHSMTQTKLMVLRQGTPLVLLPQTYGPFEAPWAQRTARKIVREAGMAWARDAHSFETLKDLLGPALDPARHDTGVDVAFALPRAEPTDLPEQLARWIAPVRSRPVVGINVSGLIHNQGAEGSHQFGFQSDYREIIREILSRFLTQSDANIVLVPHVLSGLDHYESDPAACLRSAADFDDEPRLCVLDRRYDAMQMKWVIAQLDYFCGTRMHSTIAGLSSGVPTAAIAYSKKTLGVFETCGLGASVVDPRQMSMNDCLEGIWTSWEQREQAAATLAERLPAVKDAAQNQTNRIFDYIDEVRGM